MKFRSTVLGLSILTALSLLILPAHAADPYTQPNDSWISVTGTVADTHGESFELDFGEGLITVEFDDWDWYNENAAILDGDRVTVYGTVDDDLYETRTIEAGSVYVKGLNTYYYASATDEEDFPLTWTTAVIVDDLDLMILSGQVETVDGREFTIDTGVREVRIDTIAMPYNPMDDKGFQQIGVGDWVSVSGYLDLDLFESREIVAESIVTLDDSDSNESVPGR